MKKKLIKDVLQNFDWKKVAGVMRFLDWEWYSVGVPNEQQLKDKAEGMLNEVCQLAKDYRKENPKYRGPYTLGTAGLEAQAWLTVDGSLDGVSLKFVAKEWVAHR